MAAGGAADTSGEARRRQPPRRHARSGQRAKQALQAKIAEGHGYSEHQWRTLPKDLPSKSTVFRYFDLWNHDGTLLHHELYVLCREQAGLVQPLPSSTVILRQAQDEGAKSAETLRQAQEGACIDPHGYDAGKKINGKKRHIAVDTLGLNLAAVVHSAGIQDRDGGPLVLQDLRPRFPCITKIIADGGTQGPKMAAAVAAICHEWEIEIVNRPELGKFVVLPKRWLSMVRQAHHEGTFPPDLIRGSTGVAGRPRISTT